MAYRVDYSSNIPVQRKGTSFRRRWYFTIFCFLLFLSMLTKYWPRGREVLQRLLIPGDPDVTLAAAEAFARDLGCGMSFWYAAHAFCHTIISYGQTF